MRAHTHTRARTHTLTHHTHAHTHLTHQVNPDRVFSIASAARTGHAIVHTQGVLALWRGNMATMTKVIPYSALTYTTFDSYERALSVMVNGGTSTFWTRCEEISHTQHDSR